MVCTWPSSLVRESCDDIHGAHVADGRCAVCQFTMFAFNLNFLNCIGTQ
jgi:hypothetical protein